MSWSKRGMSVSLTARVGLACAVVFSVAVGCGTAAPVGDPASADASAPLSAPLAPAAAPGPAPARPRAKLTPLVMPRARAGGIVYRNFKDAKTPEHPVLAGARAILGADKGAAHVLDEHPRSLALTDEGFVSKGRRLPPPGNDTSHMGAVLPHRANDVTYVSAGNVQRWAMTLAPEGRADVAGQLDRGRVVYPNAVPHGDVIATSDERIVEELIVLRDAEAPTTYRWRVHTGSGLTRRAEGLPDGAIEFLDSRGDAALRIHQPFAVDAKGKRASVSMTLGEDELVVSLDTKGLAFPVVLDPAAEVPIMQYVSTGPYPPASGPGVAYNPTTGRTTMLSGQTNGGTLTDSYTWNGATWTAMGANATAASRSAATVSDWGISSFGGLIMYGGKNSAGTVLADSWMMNTTPWFGVSTAANLANGTYYFRFPDSPTNKTDPVSTSNTGAATTYTMPPMYASAAANIGPYAVMFGTDRNTYTFSYPSWSLFPLTTNDVQYWTPSPRMGAAMAGTNNNSSTPGRVILVSGLPMLQNSPSGAFPAPAIPDAWEFNPGAAGNYSTPHWQPICGLLGPTYSNGCPFVPRFGAGMAYDSVRGKYYMGFGFAGDGDANDLWELDPTTRLWTNLLPMGNSMAPSREFPGMTFDQGRRRVVFTGGYYLGWYNYTYEIYVRGGSCGADSDCDSVSGAAAGRCVEGTCCETVCAECQTCLDPTGTNPNTVGQCKNVAAGAPDPTGACTTGSCNGGSGPSACRSPLGAACGAPSACGSGNCVNGTCCSTSSCGVNLTCADPAGTCKSANGQTCLNGSTCASGNCVDGVCCGSASCGANQHCNYTRQPGTCLGDNGQACTSNTTCGSGNCADGYCCNSACSGECQACDVGGALGTCIPVSGAPHNNGATGPARAACAGSGACGSVCNGSDTGACHYPGASVACGTASCTNGTATQVGTCDGTGNCAQPTMSCAPYTCGATTCKIPCTTDNDCSTTTLWCNSGSCSPKVVLGSTCTTGRACTSGNCVDGVCCSAATCGAGQHCNAPRNPGTCLGDLGKACIDGTTCASGNCVDGVCCDQACTGTCQACTSALKGGGADGICGNTAPGMDPRSNCPAQATTTCGRAGGCDGKGGCRLWGIGTACGTNSVCVQNVAKGSTCDGMGVCIPNGVNATGVACDTMYGEVCRNGGCVSPCQSDNDCAGGYFCNAGTCTVNADRGAACTVAAHCKSGYCVDGVCCDGPCTGKCQSCAAATKAPSADGGVSADGVCGAAKAGIPAPHRGDCTTSDPITCGQNGQCDGMEACALYASGTKCGDTTCKGDSEQDGHACDGLGTCQPNAVLQCKAYKCKGTSCLTSCTNDTDCSQDNFCKSGACVPKSDNGQTCTAATTCKSGFCVDGVCCDQACSGQCEACDLSTAKGKCSPVLGPPHGTRPVCAAGGQPGTDEACQARSCDGTKTRASCVGYVGSEVACRAKACVDGVETISATCNGAGQCGAAGQSLSRPCEPFACDQLACKTACKTDGDCKTPYKCDATSGKCVTGNSCSDDHTVAKQGGGTSDCTPFKCNPGTGDCFPSCATVNDCVAPNVCSETGRCGATAAPTAPSSGGCGCKVVGGSGGSGGSSRAGGALGLVLAAAALRRRRRGADAGERGDARSR